MTVASKSLGEYDEIELMQLNGPGLNVDVHPTSSSAPQAMVSQVVGFFGVEGKQQRAGEGVEEFVGHGRDGKFARALL